MPYRIVVVEDSQALNDLLCDALTKAGYTVDGFLDAESLSEFALIKDTDVIVLDIQLPGESGLDLARRLRRLMPNLGVLMLTARTTTMDRIDGYDSGADYYLPKPISPQELVRAVKSLLARKQQFGLDSPTERFKLSRKTLMLSSGDRSIKLSVGDAAILVALASAPDQQLEHWQIMDLLSKDGDTVNRASLDVRIYRLRVRLADFVSESYPIVSIRGVGYRLGFGLEIV